MDNPRQVAFGAPERGGVLLCWHPLLHSSYLLCLPNRLACSRTHRRVSRCGRRRRLAVSSRPTPRRQCQSARSLRDCSMDQSCALASILQTAGKEGTVAQELEMKDAHNSERWLVGM